VTALEPWEAEALEVARYLARCGVPIFVAPPRAHDKMPFHLPPAWQTTPADPAVVDQWQPGWALCAVQGVVTDTIDIDPRNGGNASALNGTMPRVHGRAHTPNGGEHLFIAPLGVGSKNGFLPGIDLRGGTSEASSRGFVFLSPTRKPDKAGVVRPYVWEHPPRPIPAQISTDTSGRALAELIGRPKPKQEQASTGQTQLDAFLNQEPPQRASAATQAIQRKRAEVVQAGPACTRELLMSFAYMLGGYVGGGFMTRTQAWDEYAGACAAVWGTPDSDDETWFTQGLTDGSRRPFHVYDDTQPQAAGVPPQGPGLVPQAAEPGSPLEWLRSKLVTSEGLKALPPPQPLVEGLLFEDTLSWLIGAPGHGKSFVAVDMACSIATGTPWHNRPVRQGPVIYLVAEGVTGAGQRVEAWEQMHGRPAEGLLFLPYPVQLAAGGQLVEPFQQLVTEVQPRLVVVDTQARTSVGVDENSAKDIGVLIGNLDGLRTASPQTSVLVIHHTPRGSDNPRGSTSIEGAADTILLCSKDESWVTLKVRKQKDAQEGPDERLRLVPQRNGSAALAHGAGGESVGLHLTAELIYQQMLEAGGLWTITQVTELGVARSTAQRHLKDLEVRGMVRVDRSTTHWKYAAQRLGPAGPPAPLDTPPGPRPAGPQPAGPQPVDNLPKPVDKGAHFPSGHLPAETAWAAQPAQKGAHDKSAGQSANAQGAQTVPTDDPGVPAHTPTLRGGQGPGPGLASEHSESESVSPPAGPSPTPDPLTKARASKQARSDQKAAERQARISEAAGPDVIYPVVVLRDGTVARDLTLTEAEALLALDDLTVDVETSGYPLGHELYELRLAQLGNEHYGVVLDPADAAQAKLISQAIERAKVLRAHSAAADLVPLADAGLLDFDTAWAKTEDTVLAAKLSDPASTGSDPGLKQLADHLLGPESASTPADEARAKLWTAMGCLTKPKVTDPPHKNGWHSVNKRSTTFARYAGSDVLDCALVARRLPALPDWLVQRERTVAHMVSRVALHGVPLDGAKLNQLHTEHTQARKDITAMIRDRYGIDNPGSSKQVAEALHSRGIELPRTKPSKTHPDGQLSVAGDILESLAGQYHENTAEGGAIRDVLTYRHHNTALGLFLEPYKVMLDHGDGRARTTIYTLGADTGRMSSTRFNFQQLPKVGGFRAVMATDPGMLQIGADFSSVEIRVAAEVSGDQALLRMLEEGLDPHAMAAELVFGPGWTKEQRYKVKAGVFGRIYGGGLKTLAAQMGVPHYIAQKLIDAIDTLWPTLSQWSRAITAAVESGLMTTWPSYSGRIIHLPRDKAYAAPNYIIQGTARELLMDALLQWRETPWGNCVLWPVHDEIDVHVPADQAAEATAELVRCMEVTMPSGVRIVAEPSEPSQYWQDAA
jgi:DNA polymerase I-like protein with 3'-5' exonuclease and polymerase domains